MTHINTILRSLMVGLICCALLTPAWAAAQLSGTVNINTASVAELAQLPGIGAAKAQAIVAQRSTSKFSAAKDLMDIRGIGPKLFAKIEKHVSVSGNTTLRSTPTKSPASR